ncbi:MAG: MauE/DoxX family redox-associated membrane protein, partial [Chitinophagaceae bacterium]
MKRLLWISRILVGVLFIFSGLIKANDPLGLSYKMQEFFEVWGWTFLNDYTLAFSVLMIAFEIIAGVAVLVGWQMNLFSWLLLLLILFFTFLTGYALFSGQIKECGCFGNCIPLKAGQSFVKDLVLLVLICFIFSQRKKINSRLPFKIS